MVGFQATWPKGPLSSLQMTPWKELLKLPLYKASLLSVWGHLSPQSPLLGLLW